MKRLVHFSAACAAWSLAFPAAVAAASIGVVEEGHTASAASGASSGVPHHRSLRAPTTEAAPVPRLPLATAQSARWKRSLHSPAKQQTQATAATPGALHLHGRAAAAHVAGELATGGATVAQGAVRHVLCGEIGFGSAESQNCETFMHEVCHGTGPKRAPVKGANHRIPTYEECQVFFGARKEEVKEKEASPPQCVDDPPAWSSSRGNCEDFSENEWCTERGGYGDAWLDEWGSFQDSDNANLGFTAVQACCSCGGGRRGPVNLAVDAKKAKKASTKQGPAAVPSAAPEMYSPAPGPAGFKPGPPLFGTKKDRPIRSQGFEGKHVKHEDMETYAGDWQREFGPASGSRSILTICREHPGNEWCELHGYYGRTMAEKPVRVGFLPLMLGVLIAVCCALGAVMWCLRPTPV